MVYYRVRVRMVYGVLLYVPTYFYHHILYVICVYTEDGGRTTIHPDCTVGTHFILYGIGRYR